MNDNCKTDRPQGMAMCDQPPPPQRGPLTDAICELKIARDNASTNHDICVSEKRYDEAAAARERSESMGKAIHILTAANAVMGG